MNEFTRVDTGTRELVQQRNTRHTFFFCHWFFQPLLCSLVYCFMNQDLLAPATQKIILINKHSGGACERVCVCACSVAMHRHTYRMTTIVMWTCVCLRGVCKHKINDKQGHSQHQQPSIRYAGNLSACTLIRPRFCISYVTYKYKIPICHCN